ncbi:hypothetical protein [uncultured Sulfitobacter sp.]|uniref:hypothetical protein n=1 Tax=uncultured Sulfitobacter sp. TaxID=191468 RepID=UPI00260B3A87|nr:hypothetical protein [uncultured Sulfitobacter sp.]
MINHYSKGTYLETVREYKNCVVHLIERTQVVDGIRQIHFDWKAVHYGKEIGGDHELDKATAYAAACAACDVHLSQPYRFPVNFVGYYDAVAGDVVTQEGEYLGRWEIDENDHPSFFPDGEDEPMFFEMNLGNLARKVSDWYEDGD